MVQGLLLNRVHTKTGTMAISDQFQLTAYISPHKAETSGIF
jgi:hypothetical protein